jgi:drug/metabolite transporter (DMT)-like permease
MNDSTRLGPWLGLILSAFGLLLVAWNLFPQDPHGTNANNIIAIVATVALLDAAWLNSTLPRMAGIGIGVLCGIGLILLGTFYHGDSNTVAITTVTAGVLVAAFAATATTATD